MNHSWVVKYSNFNKKFNIFFFFFLINNENLFYNNLFFSNLFLLTKKINYFNKNNNKNFTLNLEKKLTNYRLNKINFKINNNNKNINFFNENFIFIKEKNNEFMFLKKEKKLINKLINLFFLFNSSLFDSRFKQSGFMHFFYIKDVKNKITIMNTRKFLLRWTNSFNLLFNIFLYNLNPLFYSSPLFKNETISLNWYYHKWNYDFWRYYYNFFFFKTNKFNKKVNFFYEKIKDLNFNFFIITDCLYHFKNIFYFSSFQFYTIGLVPSSINPWIVSYPIITFFDNYLIQLFFFKLIIFLNKQALLKKFFFFQKLWSQILFFSKRSL